MSEPARRAHLVGLDNYGLAPLGLTPEATLEWAVAHGADGVAFSGFSAEVEAAIDARALDRLAAFAGAHGLYLEWGGAQHVPRDLATWQPKSIDVVNRRAAEQAARLGARVVRSCSGGLMRWHDAAPPTEALLRETAAALLSQRTMWKELGLTLAIETHFEFTSFELVRLLEMCDAPPGGWLGICLDTMNLLTMIEDPVGAACRLLPWVVSTHIKDGGIALDTDGLTTFTAPIGEGIVDIPRIVALLDSLDRQVPLSVEDHGGAFRIPVFDPVFLSRFPDLTVHEFARSIGFAATSAARGLEPLAREAWPAVAAGRIARDLAALAGLVNAPESRGALPERRDR
jgi:3-oxoisoapionate decarboxylase